MDDTLRFVIADLDYRLSHGGESVPAGWNREKKGELAALTRRGGGDLWVFLHGTFSSADQFLPLAEHIAPDAVWLLDLPGFGRSPNRPGSDLVGDYASAVVEAIRDAVRPVRLAGHSFGALVAEKAASMIPERIEHLYLLQPAYRPLQRPAGGSVAARFPSLLQWLMTPSRLKRLLIETAAFSREEEIPGGYVEGIIREMKSPRIRSANARVLGYLAQRHVPEARGLLPARSTVIWGEKDAAFAMPEGKASVITLPYPHQFPLAYPKETAKTLTAHSRALTTEGQRDILRI